MEVEPRKTDKIGAAPQQNSLAYHSKEELLQLVSKRHVPHWSPEEEEELIDPIEKLVRYLIPIPQTYYWDIVNQQPDDLKNIPRSIRLWHTSIAGCERLGQWTSNHIGMPVAKQLGLLESRFQGTIDQMTAEELQASKARVEQRRQQDESARVV